MICALASHHHVFCFQSGGSKKSEDWGGGLKILGLGHYQFGQVIFGGSVPHYMSCLLCHFNFINLLQTAISNTIHLFRSSIRVIYVLKNLSFQEFHAEGRLLFALKVSGLGLLSSMSLDGSKDIQSLVSMVNFTRFKLTYLDSGNAITFPIFTI